MYHAILAPMFVGIADTCPGSRDLRGCRCGKPRWSFLSTGAPRPSTPPPRDPSLAGGESLVLSQGDSHGPFLHQVPDAFARRRPRASQRAVVQVPRVRRSAPVFGTGLRHRPPTLRRKSGRGQRRRHRRQTQTQRVRGARSQPGDHRPQRRRQGACPTLRTAPFRWTARGHSSRAHGDDVRRRSLHRQDAHPGLRASQAAHSRAAVHGTGPAHRAVGGDASASRSRPRSSRAG